MCKIMAAHKLTLGFLRNGPTQRNLFGPVDREQLHAEYQAALSKDLEEASVRWGFDFIRDKPLDSSDFQWEGIPVTRVPLFYRSCMLIQGYAEGHRAADVAVSHKGSRAAPAESEKENMPHTPGRCTLDLDNVGEMPERREFTGLKRKQANITDFYQAKRRIVGKPRKSGE